MATSPGTPTTSRWVSLLSPLALLVTIGCVSWRITRGVDLSDESYYAIFLHEWFKEGIRASPFLMLHQISELVVYPAALVYRALVGSTGGLILFLRCLYMLGSTIAALSTVQFLRRAGVGSIRWISGSLVVAFIPYNLPAPSYNTLGLQALIVACATFGSAVLTSPKGMKPVVFLSLSAVGWAVAILAYPALLLPFIALLVLAFMILRPARAFALTYLAALAVAQGTTGALVVWIFGLRRIARSLDFQGKSSSTFDLHQTPEKLAGLLVQNRWFALVLAMAVLLGLLRKKIPAATVALANAVLLVSLLFLPPALWSMSHGVVLVAAISGIWLIGGWRQKLDLSLTTMSVLYSVSCVAGLGMAAVTTATLGAFKLPVGSFMAAVIAVSAASIQCVKAGRPRYAPVAVTTLWVALLFSLSHSYYGESPLGQTARRMRIARGPFAGLAASMNDARLIQVAGQAIEKYERAGDTIAVLGRQPGLYLLSNARVRTLMPYPLTHFATSSVRTAIHDYYADLANRPTLVLIHTDLPVINPFDPDFEKWYRLKERFASPLGSLEVFRRVDDLR
jgi:hypothetical protein